jgi:hypothetical protein
MALIECPECSKSVSSTIDACIHCGYRLNTPANKNSKPQATRDSIPASNSRDKKQSNLRSIEALDSAAYPFVCFVLFRPIFLIGILGLFALAIWFMVWTSQLLQPQCSALYDLGGEAAATSQYGHLLGYVCMPDYSGTILGSLQTLTDKGIGYLKIPVPPVVLGIFCELIGLLGIGISVLAFRKLLTQFRNSSKPDTIGSLRKLFSSRPVLASSLLAVSAAALAILVWTFPLLGPRCAVFLPLNGPEGKLLGGSGLTHYFNYVCVPFDPSLFDPSKTGLPAAQIGLVVLVICLITIAISLRTLFRTWKLATVDEASSRESEQSKEDSQSGNLFINWIHKLPSAKVVTSLGLVLLLAIILFLLSNFLNQGGSKQDSAKNSPEITNSSSPSSTPSPTPTPIQTTEPPKAASQELVSLWGRARNNDIQGGGNAQDGIWLQLTKSPGSSNLYAIFLEPGVESWFLNSAVVSVDGSDLTFTWPDGSETFGKYTGSQLKIDCGSQLDVSSDVFSYGGCNFDAEADWPNLVGVSQLVGKKLKSTTGLAAYVLKRATDDPAIGGIAYKGSIKSGGVEIYSIKLFDFSEGVSRIEYYKGATFVGWNWALTDWYTPAPGPYVLKTVCPPDSYFDPESQSYCEWESDPY